MEGQDTDTALCIDEIIGLDEYHLNRWINFIEWKEEPCDDEDSNIEIFNPYDSSTVPVSRDFNPTSWID